MAYFSGEPLFALSFSGWAVLFGLAWFSHVGGQGLIAFSLAHLPAPFSAVTLLFQPILSTLLAWIILSEAIGPEQALGGIIILVGIMVARRGSRI